jgi:hypothetical protein
MRNFTYALFAMFAAGALAGCAGSAPTSSALPGGSGEPQSTFVNGHFAPHWSKFGNLIPKEFIPLGRLPLHGRPAPAGIKSDGTTGGVYVSEYDGDTVNCYPHNNSANEAPVGTLTPGFVQPQGIAADNAGNFILPEGYENLARQVIVYGGPPLCDLEVGSLIDAYGQPDDASSANATSGNIAVANMFNVAGAGSISICTISTGQCSTDLTNSNMYEVASVVMDNSADCWASAVTEDGAATLTYFPKCAGKGKAVTGYQNQYFGGLDIDKYGNIVAISAFNAEVYVYKGCKPACTMVGGPFALMGDSLFGHLNRQSMTYTVADYQYGQIDVYAYSTTGLTYMYSYNNSLNADDEVEGVAVAPRSEK